MRSRHFDGDDPEPQPSPQPAFRRGALGDATVALLRDRVDPAGVAFAEAVALQLSRTRAASGGPRDAEREIALRVADLVASPGREEWPLRLAADPELLSSLFQNVDLLYQHGFAQADAVSLLILRALEIADPSQP